MSIWKWIQSFWQPGDFAVVSKEIQVGRVVPLQPVHPVRPIEERIKKLAKKATQRRQVALKRSRQGKAKGT